MLPLTVRTCVLAVAASVGVAALAVAPTATAASAPPPVIVAVVGDPGLNVLHAEFAGSVPRPATMPAATTVRLPSAGSFNDRLTETRGGPLGHLKAGVLYTVAGTKIDVVAPVAPAAGYDLLADRYHGTGVVGALAGNRTGTNPAVRVVFVVGNSKATWDWAAAQPWIDIVTTSDISVFDGSAPTQALCGPGAAVRKMSQNGKLVFASAGNVEQYGAVGSPNAMPEVYRVGGVDSSGTPWGGVHPEQPDPNLALGQVTHPYDSGDLYAFPTASSDSLTASMQFGGTSGATPRTAGRAARLVASARGVLKQRGAPRPGTLASGLASRVPQGPLVDGRLDRSELADVLRSSAHPTTPAQPGRYFIEGYGAHDAGTIRQAAAQLLGTAARPNRSDEDTAHTAWLTARQAFFPPGRC